MEQWPGSKLGKEYDKAVHCHPAYLTFMQSTSWASQVALVVKNPSANAGDIRDEDSIPGSGRYPGGGHGNPLQYSCLKNPMDWGVCWATVYRVAKSWTQLKLLTHTHTHRCMHIMWNARLDESQTGIKTAGGTANNLRYHSKGRK